MRRSRHTRLSEDFAQLPRTHTHTHTRTHTPISLAELSLYALLSPAETTWPLTRGTCVGNITAEQCWPVTLNGSAHTTGLEPAACACVHEFMHGCKSVWLLLCVHASHCCLHVCMKQEKQSSFHFSYFGQFCPLFGWQITAMTKKWESFFFVFFTVFDQSEQATMYIID